MDKMTSDLADLKNRIIDIDELFKKLAVKEKELNSLSSDYQALLEKYNRRCEESKREEKNCYVNARRELANSFQSQYKTLKVEYDELQAKHNEYVNSSQIKFNTSFAETENSIAEKNKLINKLQKTVSNLTKRLENNILKTPPKRTAKIKKEGSSETCDGTVSDQQDINENKYAEELRESRLEITALRSQLDETNMYKEKCENMRQENQELQKRFKQKEVRYESSRKQVSSLQAQNARLSERVTALTLEMNILNSDLNNKDASSKWTQTENSDNESVFGISTDEIFKEMGCIPRLVSPFGSGFDDDEANECSLEDVPCMSAAESDTWLASNDSTQSGNLINSSGTFIVSSLDEQNIQTNETVVRRKINKEKKIVINASNVNVNLRDRSIFNHKLRSCASCKNSSYAISRRNRGLIGFSDRRVNSLRTIYENRELNILPRNNRKIKKKQKVNINKYTNSIYNRLLKDVIGHFSKIERSNWRQNISRLGVDEIRAYMSETELESVDSGYSTRVVSECDYSNPVLPEQLSEKSKEVQSVSLLLQENLNSHFENVDSNPNKSVGPAAELRDDDTCKEFGDTDTVVCNENDDRIFPKIVSSTHESNRPEEPSEEHKKGIIIDPNLIVPDLTDDEEDQISESKPKKCKLAKKVSLRSRLTSMITRARSRHKIPLKEPEKKGKRKTKKNEIVSRKNEENCDISNFESITDVIEQVVNYSQVSSISVNSANDAKEKIGESELFIKKRVRIAHISKDPAVGKSDLPVESERKIRKFKRPLSRKIIEDSPRSPEPSDSEIDSSAWPVIIPLEKISDDCRSCFLQVETNESSLPNSNNRFPPESDVHNEVLDGVVEEGLDQHQKIKKMPKVTLRKLLDEVLNYPDELHVVEKVANEVMYQDFDYVADAILRKVSADKEDPEGEWPAPPLTARQQILLGFVITVEKIGAAGFINSFLTRTELWILTEEYVQCLTRLTRMYAAVCRSQQDIHRIRRMCLDAFYHMGDLSIPFMRAVLLSGMEVLLKQDECEGNFVVSVLINAILYKQCTTPGYNLEAVKHIVTKFYKFNPDNFNTQELFAKLWARFQENPSKDLELAILVLFKNQTSKWVFQQINEKFKPIVANSGDMKLRNAIVLLTGHIMNQFNEEEETDQSFMKDIEIWLKGVYEKYTGKAVEENLELSRNK